MIKKEKGIEYEVINGKKHSKINLLFIHGTGCNKKFLRDFAVLFKEYNCYLIDLPGHGNSDNTGYKFDNYVKAISYLARKLSNVIIIGHSLGGTLALKISSLKLKSVVGSVILNSAASWPKLDKDIMKKVRQGIIDIEWLMKAAGHTDNEDVMNAIKTMDPAGHTIADFLIDEYINVENCLKNIKVPTLIIGGEDEILALPEYSKRLHEQIDKSKLVMIPGGRHMVWLAEKHKVKDLVCDFISKDILKERKAVLV